MLDGSGLRMEQVDAYAAAAAGIVYRGASRSDQR